MKKYVIALYNADTETTKYLWVNPMKTELYSTVFNPHNAAFCNNEEQASEIAKSVFGTSIGEFKVDSVLLCLVSGF